MKAVKDADGTILNAAVLHARDVVHKRVLCPACGQKVFVMWPEGWDGHAAWRCDGLGSESREDRKAEYKQTLGHLFR